MGHYPFQIWFWISIEFRGHPCWSNILDIPILPVFIANKSETSGKPRQKDAVSTKLFHPLWDLVPDMEEVVRCYIWFSILWLHSCWRVGCELVQNYGVIAFPLATTSKNGMWSTTEKPRINIDTHFDCDSLEIQYSTDMPSPTPWSNIKAWSFRLHQPKAYYVQRILCACPMLDSEGRL